MADIVNAGATAAGPLNSGALPANTDLVIYKGDFVRLLVTVKDSGGLAVDLTGAVPKASLKSDYNDRNERPFECTIVGSPTLGQIEVFLPSTLTSTLLPGSYIYDFQITFVDGNTRTYLTGDVTVYPEVTT